MRTRTKLAAVSVVVAALAVAAFLALIPSGGEKILLREERAPLDERLLLPSSVGRVRWVAVAAFVDSGWLEAPEKPYDLYALLEVEPATPVSSEPGTVVLPEAVAHALLPASVRMSAPDQTGNVTVSGSALPVPIKSRKADVSVRAAIRLDVGILLRLFQSGGF
ncbi:MAG: hypothetical protein ABI488_18530 [Polyangiaceae bacterium]